MTLHTQLEAARAEAERANAEVARLEKFIQDEPRRWFAVIDKNDGLPRRWSHASMVRIGGDVEVEVIELKPGWKVVRDEPAKPFVVTDAIAASFWLAKDPCRPSLQDRKNTAAAFTRAGIPAVAEGEGSCNRDCDCVGPCKMEKQP